MKKILLFLLFPFSLFAQDGLKTLIAGGVADAYTISESLPSVYDQKERFQIIFPFTNTGAASLKRATLAIKAIKKPDGTALSANDLIAGSPYLISYNSNAGYYICETCGGGSSGGVTSVATSNGLTGGPITGTGTISGVNSAADGSTKGVASFTAADFDASSGNISLDYTNGQKATGSITGFLSSADWTTFNNKQNALTAGVDYEVPLTFNNGLTRIANTIKWGGPFTATTQAGSNGSGNFVYDNTGSIWNAGAVGAWYGTPGNYSLDYAYWQAFNRLVEFGVRNSSVGKNAFFTINGTSGAPTVKISGSSGFAGLQEASDLSGNYTSLSHINKGYAIATFAPIAINGTVTSVASSDGSITVTNPTTTVDLAIVKSPILTTSRTIGTITGDATSAGSSFNGSANNTNALTLATVNSNVGTFGSATTSLTETVDAKGRITAVSSQTVTPAVGSITGLGTGVSTALGINIGSAGALITFNGAAGTPSSLTGTNITGTASGLTAGNVTTNANLTGPIASVGNATSITSQTGTGTTFMMSASPSYTGTATYGTLGYSDTDIAISFQKSVNSYFQTIWQNTNAGATASTDLVISSDNGTATTNYVNLGRNGSGFSNGAGSLNQPGYGYLTNTSSDMVIGTTTNNALRFVVNGGTTDALIINANSGITGNAVWTASANNQIGYQFNHTATSRATSGDAITATQMANTFNVMSTLINPVGLDLSVTYVQTGGVSSTVASTTTVTGMTATTYTNVAPASTTGSGTGALFTVIVGSTTSITSITQTTPGSGYKVMETITFNGSQFGSGSGSAIFTIRTVTGVSLASIASPLRIGITGAHYLDSPHSIDFYNGGVYAGGIGYSNLGGAFSQAIGFFDATSLNFSFNNANGITFSKAAVMAAGLTLSGATNITNTVVTSSTITSNYVNPINGVTTSAGVIMAGTSGGMVTSNNFQSKIRLAATIGITTQGVGIPSAVSLISGGTGYTTGVKATTGGTGTGFQITVSTVSSGVVTAITFTALFAGTANGSGYTINDVLTISTGGANATFTVTAVDYAGNIIGFDDFNNYTDARSNNLYASFYSRPTYNITSTQIGSTWLAYYNPTYTAIGSFIKGGFAIVPTGTVNGIGNAIANINSTLDVNGSLAGAIATVSANTTLDATYHTVLVDASGGNKTITLPAASGATRRKYIVVKSDASANTVTINTTAGGNKVINTQYAGFQTQSDGANWYVIASF